VIRLASWIVGSLLVSAAIAFLISLPGTITLDLAGYRLQPRLGVAAILLVVLVGIVMLVWALVARLLAAPRYLARRAETRRRGMGVDALSDGFIALEGGDYARARMLARDAQLNLPGNLAAHILEARADLGLGDMGAAREHYRALISNPKTALAALSGLYEQARAQGRQEAALTFARKASGIAPRAGWASSAVFDDLVRRGRWVEALAMVADEPANTREEKQHKRRRQAVLETARAREAEPTDSLAALDHALAALRVVPDFVPAALIAARIHAHRGEGRRAMSLLRRVWRATGHPDVATLYASTVPGASAVDRFRRIRELIDAPPQDRGAAIVYARAATDAYEWSAARNALAPYSAADPTQAVCMLMAEIEEGQNGDQGKAREWLARAVHAPADPAWTADGVVAAEWEPVSPVSGRLDAFQWRVPVESAPARPNGAGGTAVAMVTGGTAMPLPTGAADQQGAAGSSPA
jgi:HemY protein